MSWHGTHQCHKNSYLCELKEPYQFVGPAVWVKGCTVHGSKKDSSLKHKNLYHEPVLVHWLSGTNAFIDFNKQVQNTWTKNQSISRP
jgi:hypothetical protein